MDGFFAWERAEKSPKGRNQFGKQSVKKFQKWSKIVLKKHFQSHNVERLPYGSDAADSVSRVALSLDCHQ